MNRILSSAVKVAGSVALIGGAMAAATTPAGAVVAPTNAYGLSAAGTVTITPVAQADFTNTPQVSKALVYPRFLTTGGILDRATATTSFSQVGSPKVYLEPFSQVDQLNASMVSSTCQIPPLGPPVGDTTIQAGSIVLPDFPTFLPPSPPIPLIRNPAPNTVIPVAPGVTVTLNKQAVTGVGPNAVFTVTGIFITLPGQTISIAVSSCGANLG